MGKTDQNIFVHFNIQYFQKKETTLWALTPQQNMETRYFLGEAWILQGLAKNLIKFGFTF